MKPRIVVVDGYTLNPGDLSWSGVEALGELTVYERTSPDQVIERVREADIVLTNKVPFTREALSQLPRLRYIGVTATGYNNIDVAAARERGIVVTNVPDYSTASVAQFTFALILELCHRVQRHSDAVQAGAWSRSPDFCFTLTPQVELAGKRLGIVGLGRIGRRVAQIARAFGMEVQAASRVSSAAGRSSEQVPGQVSGRPEGIAGERATGDGDEAVPRVPLEELLATSDVVSLHCPLTPETQGLINRSRLERMKESAFLINTARGGLVVDRDLAEALAEGRIAGAALDVLSLEPPPPDNPLLGAPRCIVTPHMAWMSREARTRLMGVVVENLRRFLAGDPVNVVG